MGVIPQFPSHAAARRTVWWAAALLLLGACLGWTLLSFQFQYGQGHAERPIPLFLVLYGVGFTGFLLAVAALRSTLPKPSLLFIVLVAVAARLVLLPSELIQENDVYRYVLDGQVLRHGENPYQWSPLVVDDMVTEPLRSELRRPEAQQVLHRVGYPEVPTVYPPATQVFFAAGTLLGGWDWRGQRLVFLLVDLGTMALLTVLLRTLALPASWMLLYAWNPLVLKEIANSAHFDGLVALFLGSALFVLLLRHRLGDLVVALLAGLFLGFAVLVKLYPLLLTPAFLLMLLRRHVSRIPAATFLGGVAATVLLGFAPFLSIGWERMTAGLQTYGSQWKMNEGAFALLESAVPEPRLVAGAVMLALSLWIPWRRTGAGVAKLVGDLQWLLLFWWLLLPAAYPWYAVPLLFLLALKPVGPPVAAIIVLSGAASLYYVSFLYEYRGWPEIWWTWVRTFEHGIVWVALALPILLRYLPKGRGLVFRVLRKAEPRSDQIKVKV